MFQLALAALLQLSLALFVEAAPVSVQSTGWQGPTGGGIVGFIVLVLDIIAWGMSFTSAYCTAPGSVHSTPFVAHC